MEWVVIGTVVIFAGATGLLYTMAKQRKKDAEALKLALKRQASKEKRSASAKAAAQKKKMTKLQVPVAELQGFDNEAPNVVGNGHASPLDLT